MTTPPIFPALNTGWSSVKRAIAGATKLASAGTGREVRARQFVYPMWQWDLTWENLPDRAGTGGVTDSDFRTLIGMFLLAAGQSSGFLFQDPDENSVAAQPVATGDGATTAFLLIKTFAGVSEPIGYLNEAARFTVYLNGVAQADTAYSVSTANPYGQGLGFITAPGDGVAITVDMGFYYWVKFKEDEIEFDEFMASLWEQSKITLESLKY